jgi:hypothetical protein
MKAKVEYVKLQEIQSSLSSQSSDGPTGEAFDEATYLQRLYEEKLHQRSKDMT